MFEVELRPSAALQASRRDWNSLRAGQSLLPIFDAEFFELLLEHFGDGRERLAICSSGSHPVAMGIVHPGGRFTWETFQPSQAPISAWLVDPTSDASRVYAAIMRRLPGACLHLAITQQDPSVSAPPEARGSLRPLDYVDIARLELSDNFEVYWAARGKNLKQNLRRQRNKLERDGVSIRCEVVSLVDQMNDGVNRYSDLESRGWKSDGGTALIRGGVQARFYGALMEHYASLGEARVFQLFFGDQLVAIDLCICRNHTLVILKTTHDESIQQMSPAMLLKQEIIRMGYESGDFSCIEFYGKVMEWHRRLTDSFRRLYHVNAFRTPLLARLHDLRVSRSKRGSQATAPAAVAEQASES